ncbi:unnamed protein product [Rhizoctonia solani]|uniref:F-box domain-containing protein n=1 Tax=Rhizoctonia solani TaxID=456999 RepID=A0A8H3B4A9_9AGAM|nr:unnamed protein product [Rhizoctonia solani]
MVPQDETQDVKTHYPVVFAHNSQSSSVTGLADAEWWPPLSQDGNTTPDALLLFIPGNPGLVEFYTEFLEHLHRAFNKAGTRLAILVRGHIGHAPSLPTENSAWTVGLDSQVTSAIELYDSARDSFGPNTKIILAGHSVGSWIVAQVMHARPNTASGAILLFPTVSNIASTPNGRKLSWLFHRPIPTIVSNLSRLLTFPPFSAIPYILPYLSKFSDYPPDQLGAIKALVTSPHVVYSALTMAHDEMQTIGSLGNAPSTVQATCERERSRIYACFAAKDEWVGDEVSGVMEMLDRHRVIVRDDDVPHAFCIITFSTSMQTINELPVEVLSRIFVLGEGVQRGPRAIGLPYVGFQDLVVQVCRHWKEVAISTPELWTYIFISRPPPHLHAQLYVSRSGTLPLHIDLDMRTPFIKPLHPLHESEQAERALQALDFIEKIGGTRDRWGSLIILSKALFTVISIYSFFTRTPTPALQFVSIKWKARSNITDDEEDLGHQEFLFSGTSLAHSPQRPQLRHVEFSGLPKYFMFDCHSPMVSNLTRFTFICSETMSLPSHEELSGVLSASPRLEHLSVDMRAARHHFAGLESGPASIASLQIRLPLLRSFLLNTSHLHQWSLHLLQIVDAPGVQYLNINTDHGFSKSTPNELCQYLAKGRVNEALQCHTTIIDNTPGSRPIFPHLKHLNVERMTQNTQDISLIFAAFPTVTHVTFGGFGALAFYEHVECLPNASHFTYIEDDTVDLPVILELPGCRASHGVISTFVWCTDLPEELCTYLGLEDGGIYHPGSDRHYRSPPGFPVDHLIVRQIAQEPLYLGDSDEEVLAALDDEDNDLGFDVDELIIMDEEGQEEWDSEDDVGDLE